MVCLLFVGSFIGDIASALIPHLRLCTALPRNPRRSLSFKHTTSLSHSRYALEEGSHNV
jgi:hypothetical protein